MNATTTAELGNNAKNCRGNESTKQQKAQKLKLNSLIVRICLQLRPKINRVNKFVTAIDGKAGSYRKRKS